MRRHCNRRGVPVAPGEVIDDAVGPILPRFEGQGAGDELLHQLVDFGFTARWRMGK